MELESFRDLIVWQRAMQMSISIYRSTKSFPPDERFGLTNQLRRAGVSVPSNIAEGYGRMSKGEYRHFLGIARGSNLEVQTQLLIARELGFGSAAELLKAEGYSFEVGKMLTTLIQNL